MTHRFLILVLIVCNTFALASNYDGKLIFEDNFDRNESQETKDEPGQGWGTNSKSRAKGHKQVDLRNGAMYIYTHAEADHGASVTHSAEMKDGAVALRFMLENKGDTLGLDFADLACKEVHAGHLFVARVSTKGVQLSDLKTGNMRLDIRETRTAKKELSDEQKKALVGKDQNFSRPIEVGKWYELLVTVEGDKLTAFLDGEQAGSLSSPGIAHPTKKMLRLAVPKSAVVDDVKIWAKAQ